MASKGPTCQNCYHVAAFPRKRTRGAKRGAVHLDKTDGGTGSKCQHSNMMLTPEKVGSCCHRQDRRTLQKNLTFVSDPIQGVLGTAPYIAAVNRIQRLVPTVAQGTATSVVVGANKSTVWSVLGILRPWPRFCTLRIYFRRAWRSEVRLSAALY